MDCVYKLLQTIATKKSSVNGYSYDSCFQRILKSLMCTFFQYSAKMIWQRICVIDNNERSKNVPTPILPGLGGGQVSNLSNSNLNGNILPTIFYPNSDNLNNPLAENVI